ncbi:MAG: PDZ domain-containing protein, partial [Acidimicrobiia bacterium]|nr:PDZ domain-containing protein [Acidimicrobiia bacterium]
PSSRFATPYDHVRRVFEQVVEHGRFTYPALGITGEGLTVEQAERLGISRGTGVRIDNAEEGSPARQAGLRDGDVILEFGRQPVSSLNDLLTELRRYDPGDVVFISYLRNGEEELGAAWLTEDPALP